MNERLSNQTSVVLFADPPALDDLCVISVCVNKILQTVPSTSRFQIQTIKCREIIFTEPDVIASPSFELESIFHVVLQQALFKTGRLQTRFQKLGLEISKPSFVTPAQYQSCLRYTLLAKLAPNWNKAGQWLIQGRDFLMQAGYANAIKMDLTVTNGELFFTIDASTVRFPSLTIEDLDVPAPCYNKFLQNKSAIIHQHSIPMVWCHILPSMKKGTIVNITHELPDDGPFRSYKELKRHWKNHYGYRLPEEEDGMIYYQINFRPLGERLFTYPLLLYLKEHIVKHVSTTSFRNMIFCVTRLLPLHVFKYPEPCLRARDIQRVPRVDPKPILISFLQDLQKKMPRICGFPLKLHSKACYPTIDLAEVTKVEKRPIQNLSTKIPQKKIIYRNNDDIQKLISKVPECHTSKQDHTLPVSSDGKKQASFKSTQLPNNVYLTQNSYAAADVQSHISKFHEHCQEKNYDTSSYIHESTSTDKLGIHLQEPSLITGTNIDKSSTCSEGKHHKTVPVFKQWPKTLKPSAVPSSQNEAQNRQHTVVDNTDNYVSVVNCDKNRKPVSIPSFHAKKTTNEHFSKGNVKQPMKRVENLNLNNKAAPKMGFNSVNSSSSNTRNMNVHDQCPSRNTLIMSSSNENRLSSSATSYSFQRRMGTVPATPKSHTHVPVTSKSYTPVHTTPKANMLLVGGLSSTPLYSSDEETLSIKQ
ncbi:unnamed protein product [Mytilus coruscus]|uniref:DUF4708 domain-containing protein n=1 Tax=Mytilus coruscus TaxID=42192 RepID=A0A6J8D7L6_MYTCO|nr:unnamed protein product [Mytilus coruscus]